MNRGQVAGYEKYAPSFACADVMHGCVLSGPSALLVVAFMRLEIGVEACI